jgi:hypothetical protein
MIENNIFGNGSQHNDIKKQNKKKQLHMKPQKPLHDFYFGIFL